MCKPRSVDLDAAPDVYGDRVTLRALRGDDVSRRAAFGRTRDIVRAFGGDIEADQPMSIDDAALELRARVGPGPHWVIADEDDTFIGVLRLAPVDEANRSARFGIGILDPARLGQGFGTDATRLALGYGFEQLGLHRISLTVLADNARAIAAYERCGFVVEGRLRHTLRRDGMWHDDLAMAILSTDRPSAAGARETK